MNINASQTAYLLLLAKHGPLTFEDGALLMLRNGIGVALPAEAKNAALLPTPSRFALRDAGLLEDRCHGRQWCDVITLAGRKLINHEPPANMFLCERCGSHRVHLTESVIRRFPTGIALDPEEPSHGVVSGDSEILDGGQAFVTCDDCAHGEACPITYDIM